MNITLWTYLPQSLADGYHFLSLVQMPICFLLDKPCAYLVYPILKAHFKLTGVSGNHPALKVYIVAHAFQFVHLITAMSICLPLSFLSPVFRVISITSTFRTQSETDAVRVCSIHLLSSVVESLHFSWRNDKLYLSLHVRLRDVFLSGSCLRYLNLGLCLKIKCTIERRHFLSLLRSPVYRVITGPCK